VHDARSSLGLALALVVGLASTPARALTCPEWTRLAPDAQLLRIRELVERAASQPNSEGVQVDRGALRRCLEASVGAIDNAFDDACGEGLEADLDALDRIFRDYVATCED